MIEIILNGECTVLSQPLSLRDLFDHLELDPHVVAAKVNRAAVPLPHLAGRCLRAGDIVEIVTLVGRGAEELDVQANAACRRDGDIARAESRGRIPENPRKQ